MATRVTALNGGPSGGLSTTTNSSSPTTTTPGLCNNNNNNNTPSPSTPTTPPPPTTTTTRVVIEGAQGEERLRLDTTTPTTPSFPLEGDDESEEDPPPSGALPSLESWATSSAGAGFFLDSAAIKKRRKQSRPVRIPLTGTSATDADAEGPTGSTGQGQDQGQSPHSLTLGIKSGNGGHSYGSPLNLSKTEQHNSVLLFDPTHNNNNNNTNHLSHHQVTTSPSFSPILFPLSSSSPFSGLFPGFGAQGGGLLPGHPPLNPPSGTPTSSSSNGSTHNNNNNNNNNHGPSLHNSSSMSSNRIFNPEAYCDLCNKEFCNKYFLKTHKANKHGVYTDSPSVGGSALPFLSALTSQQQSFSSSTPLGQAQGQGHLPDSSFFTAAMSADFKSRDSFCHLCRKDFCNKYFLKRHKAKIHGIHSDTPLSTSDVSNGNTPGGMMENSGDEEGEVHGSRHGGSSSGERSRDENENESEIEEGGGVNLTSPSSIKKSPEHREETGSRSGVIVQPEQQQEQASPETHGICACQLCFREFSTKGALRTHLEKKHGLMIPSTFPPSFLLPFASMASPLLFDEAGGLGGAMPLGNEQTNNDTSSPSDLDSFECNLCNRTFQTIYLLRMHKSYFHPDAMMNHGVDDNSGVDALKRFNQQQGNSSTNNKGSPGDSENGDKSSGGGVAPPFLPTTVKMEVGAGPEDSDDLRRLQSMIMELNRVSAAGTAWSPPPVPQALDLGQAEGNMTPGLTTCPICSKEFYSTYYLTQHMAQSHPNFLQDSQPIKSESPGENSGSNNNNSRQPKSTTTATTTIKQQSISAILPWSDLPGSDRDNSSFLTPTKSNGAKIGALAGAAPGAPAPSASGGDNCLSQHGKRPSPSLSRSYCTICHKELCNKYFMRTHMLKMHGISIESSTGLGGVTCDICNKELCSKYFLKVHKQNTHGIVEEGPSPPAAASTPISGVVLDVGRPSTPAMAMAMTMGQGQTDSQSPLSSTLDSLFQGVDGPSSTGGGGGGGGLSPSGAGAGGGGSSDGGGAELHTRYFSHYSEVCPICTRRFRSSKWLKTHLMSDHGSEGRDKWKNLQAIRRASQQQPQQQQGPTPTTTGLGKGKSRSGGNNNKRSQSPSKGGGKSGGSTGTGGNGGANKCVLCGANTPDIESLKMHILKEHGDELKSTETGIGIDLGGRAPPNVLLDPLNLLFQKMDGGAGSGGKLYRCSFCPFSTSLLVYLYAHERTHTGLGGNAAAVAAMGGNAPQQLSSSPHDQPLSAPLRCPMCFHTFQQLDAFQQHLIGHQMSGVLAPFFAPSAPFSSQDIFQPQRLNGSDGGGGDGSGSPQMGPLGWSPYRKDNNQQQQQQQNQTIGKKSSASGEKQQNEGKGGKKRKRRVLTNYQCSQCPTLRFESRAECASHIEQKHAHGHGHGTQRGTVRDHLHGTQSIRRNFRCRLCKFQALTYQSLLVHSRIHHSTSRPSPLGVELKGQPRVVLQDGISGDFILQRFFLRSTTENENDTGVVEPEGDENESGVIEKRSKKTTTTAEELLVSEEPECNKSGYFVPSIVYLPVREKVSGALRVSFSLTPTS